MHRNGLLNDEDCENRAMFICERKLIELDDSIIFNENIRAFSKPGAIVQLQDAK
jgi:hypothetical protein